MNFSDSTESVSEMAILCSMQCNMAMEWWVTNQTRMLHWMRHCILNGAV